MKKAKKSKWCLQLDFKNGEPKEVYPLDSKKAALSCFDILSQTYEMNPTIKVVKLTPTQWARAEKVGKELA